MAHVPTDEPFHVVADTPGYDPGHFVAGWPAQDQADTDAADRNERAEKLGIETRYRAIEKP